MGDVRIVVDERALEDFLTGPSGPVVRDGRARAEQITQGAKRRCPVSPAGSGDHPSGWLRSHIGWEQGQDESGAYFDIGVNIGVDPDPDLDYAVPVEVGTGPHTIESHGDYPLRDRQGNVFGRSVEHPGTPAQPYLRPALIEDGAR